MAGDYAAGGALAHGLDITGPFGIELPGTDRLRHVAWLVHRTLRYSMALVGEPHAQVVRPRWSGPGGLVRPRVR